jgi:type II secretion system protein G
MASKAFTLIELLIVVAIIAILAAIAVPNFLEAQTRAKVADVQADLRNLANALESYRVDNSGYPPSPYPVAGYRTLIGWVSPTNPDAHLFRQLTTPISYLNSLPRSPFKGKDWIAEAGKGYYQGHARENDPGFVVRQWVHPTGWEMFPGWQNKVWMISDVGPSLQWDNTPRNDGTIQIPYDPSNGTVSPGNIYRFGP